jgi:hypothetical protein
MFLEIVHLVIVIAVSPNFILQYWNPSSPIVTTTQLSLSFSVK